MRTLWLTTMGLVGLLMARQDAGACTVFCLADRGELLFGQNYDWPLGHGALMVNKKNMAKTAFIVRNPAKWTSRYGSVTLNQYGREFPCGGMNEAGLVVASLWLDETDYPQADHRSAINILEWIQYQLDTAATVKDVIASDRQIRITSLFGETVHYFVADRTGRCASIEFIEGELVVHAGDDLPTRALANTTYEDSITELTRYTGFGGDLALDDDALHKRFLRAAKLLKAYDRATSPIDYSFESLRKVAQGEATKWSVVYDMRSRVIHLRTLAVESVRRVKLGQLDFSPATPVQMLDMNAELAGDVTTKFTAYTKNANRKLIVTSAEGTVLLKGITRSLLELGVSHPDRHHPARPPEEDRRRQSPAGG